MRWLSLALVLGLLGCDDGSDDAGGSRAAQEPAVGRADSMDDADRACRVVLRDLGQPLGMPSHYVDGTNWVVFEGHVDVPSDEPGTVFVLYTNGSGTWREVEGTMMGGGVAGFRRYLFVLDEYTVPMGDSTAWRSMRIEVVPFLLTPDESRLFDHNRLPGAFDNYVLTADSPAVDEEPGICPNEPMAETDLVDTECLVVLRDLGQPAGMPSYNVDGTNWVVFEGHVDVASDEPGTLFVLYRNGSGAWREVEGTMMGGGAPGFRRYLFVLDGYTVPMGDSRAWQSMSIEVAPFLLAPDGVRLFDHNRVPEGSDAYALTAGSDRIEDEGLVCAER